MSFPIGHENPKHLPRVSVINHDFNHCSRVSIMTHFFNDPFGMRGVMDYAEGIDEGYGLQDRSRFYLGNAEELSSFVPVEPL